MSTSRQYSEGDTEEPVFDPRLEAWLARNNLLDRVGWLLQLHSFNLDDMFTIRKDDLLEMGFLDRDAIDLLRAADRYKHTGAMEPKLSPEKVSPQKNLRSQPPQEPAPTRQRQRPESTYERWVPPRIADKFDKGEEECQVYDQIYVKQKNGRACLSVFDPSTQEAVPVPDAMAHYILVGDLLDEIREEDEKAAAEGSVDKKSEPIGLKEKTIQSAPPLIRQSTITTFENCGLSASVLQQMLEFLNKREEDEFQAIEKSYERRTERIEAIIAEKEAELEAVRKAKEATLRTQDLYPLGTDEEIAKYSPFFHGYIARNVSEERLRAAGLRTGMYLVRQKEEHKNYVFSLVCRGGEIKHFLCERAMKKNGIMGRHFIFNKIVRLRSCNSIFAVLDELVKPPMHRMESLKAHPPPFFIGVRKVNHS